MPLDAFAGRRKCAEGKAEDKLFSNNVLEASLRKSRNLWVVPSFKFFLTSATHMELLCTEQSHRLTLTLDEICAVHEGEKQCTHITAPMHHGLV
jgi:hypothetical protein